jgi:glutamate-1-semialdehyde 2,1-aminomutase
MLGVVQELTPVKTPQTSSRMQSLAERAQAVSPGGVETAFRNLGFPFVVSKAEGARFWDADGKAYLDFHAAFGPILLGHRHPAVEKAVQQAMQSTDPIGAGISEMEILAAEKVRQHVSSAERVLLCNSGSEATYNAIRLARRVTGRPDILKFQGCYHGWYDAVALNVSSPAGKLGQKDSLTRGALEETQAHTHVCRFNDLADVERVLQAHPGRVAALLVEPVAHNVGCLMPQPGFLEGLRRLCDREGIVLVFDEVITGFRHALGGYQSIAGVLPDLTCLAKAMANGYPCAALAGKAAWMDHFSTRPGGDVLFAGTYNGHPHAMAACLATIGALESGEVHRHLFKLGDRMRAGLRAIFQEAGIPAQVAGFGSIFVPYFLEGEVRNYDDVLRHDSAADLKWRKALIEDGIFVLPKEGKRCVLNASHSVDDVDRFLETARSIVKKGLA